MDPTTVAQTLAAYARSARPTVPPPRPTLGGIAGALYGGAMNPAPLPSWLPQNVQTYIRTQPSQAEGEKPPTSSRMADSTDTPQPAEPQIADISRLFRRGIARNAPGFSSEALRKLMQMPGFSGFAGGDEI